jgi:hypothetical protein
MKTPSRWISRSILGKIMMGFVLAAMIGSMEVAPALAKDDHKRMEKHDNGRYDNKGRGYDNDRYDHSGRRYYYAHGRRVYRPYGYMQPVYAPPPVYYEPAPPPGISIFFPPIYIH